MNCLHCSSTRIVSISSKSVDLNFISYKGVEGDGYVPDFIGKWGDYVEFKLCIECGRIQDNFPLDDDVVISQIEGMSR